MKEEAPLIFDAVVLISFRSAGWFDSLAFSTANREVVTPACIWEEEFDDKPVDGPPSWLSVVEAHQEPYLDNPGKVSTQDRRCLGLAEQLNGVLVTNDQTLKNAAELRNVPTRWGTAHLLEVFHGCGISQSAYDSGVTSYTDDVYLPDSVTNRLMSEEK